MWWSVLYWVEKIEMTCVWLLFFIAGDENKCWSWEVREKSHRHGKKSFYTNQCEWYINSYFFFFGGGVWCWQDEYILYSVFKLVSLIIIIHFSGYHPLSGGGRADKARDPAESHHRLWDPVGVRTTLCLKPTEEQCKERQTYLWLYHCGWSKTLLSLFSFG